MNDWYHIICIITHFNGEFSSSFLTGIYEILSWLRDKDYSPTFKIPYYSLVYTCYSIYQHLY